MESKQRRLILEEIKQSFEEDVLMSIRQREINLRTGNNKSPYYIYGLSISSRVPFFTEEILGKKFYLNNFPELVMVRELNNFDKCWDTEIDVEMCIDYLNQAIKYNETWS